MNHRPLRIAHSHATNLTPSTTKECSKLLTALTSMRCAPLSVCNLSSMDPKPDWHVIAEQATKEMDPEKLLILAGRLCKAFDEEQTPA